MREQDCDFLPVMNAKELVGVVTGRDIAARATALRADVEHISVAAVMTSPAFAVGENVGVDEAVVIMRQQNLRHLVVRNERGDVTGVVSLADCAGVATDQAIAKNLQRHAEQSLQGSANSLLACVPGMYLG